MYVFRHIWLAGLLAYLCFDMTKRQLQRVNQIIDHAIARKCHRGQLQLFGAFRYGWIIDRLDINLMFFQQKLARSRAIDGVVDHYWCNMYVLSIIGRLAECSFCVKISA